MKCCVRGCRNVSQGQQDLTFHRFPREMTARKIWALICGTRTRDRFTMDNGRVCSEHFSPDDYRTGAGNRKLLMPSAIPTINIQSSLENDLHEIEKQHIYDEKQFQELENENKTLKDKLEKLNAKPAFSNLYKAVNNAGAAKKVTRAMQTKTEAEAGAIQSMRLNCDTYAIVENRIVMPTASLLNKIFLLEQQLEKQSEKQLEKGQDNKAFLLEQQLHKIFLLEQQLQPLQKQLEKQLEKGQDNKIFLLEQQLEEVQEKNKALEKQLEKGQDKIFLLEQQLERVQEKNKALQKQLDSVFTPKQQAKLMTEKRVNWSDDDIKKFMPIYYASPEIYKLLKETIPLPGKRTIQRRTKQVTIAPGVIQVELKTKQDKQYEGLQEMEVEILEAVQSIDENQQINEIYPENQSSSSNIQG